MPLHPEGAPASATPAAGLTRARLTSATTVRTAGSVHDRHLLPESTTRVAAHTAAKAAATVPASASRRVSQYPVGSRKSMMVANSD